MNNINIMGRLTADAELKQTQNGTPVCGFTLAVRRPHTKDKTDFINCVAWQATAQFITRYFKKGSLLAVRGILTSRNYYDKNGNNRVAYEVIIDEAYFCGEKSQTQSTEGEPTYSAEKMEEIGEDEELPF